MNDDAWRALQNWVARRTDLAISPGQWAQMRTYLDTLLAWNRKLALVSQRDLTQIINKHVADSLFAAAYCVDGEAVVDLGSGAGFPALPIAICRPASRVCLIESRGKKASFLEEARRSASIRNAVICHRRIEAASAGVEHRSQYVVATARALTSTEEFLSLARPFLVPGGRALAMRSISEARVEDAATLEAVSYELPDGTPRRLLIARF